MKKYEANQIYLAGQRLLKSKVEYEELFGIKEKVIKISRADYELLEPFILGNCELSFSIGDSILRSSGVIGFQAHVSHDEDEDVCLVILGSSHDPNMEHCTLSRFTLLMEVLKYVYRRITKEDLKANDWMRRNRNAEIRS